MNEFSLKPVIVISNPPKGSGLLEMTVFNLLE